MTRLTNRHCIGDCRVPSATENDQVVVNYD